MMSLLLLLMLLPCVCYSYDKYTAGDKYRISLRGGARIVEFTASDTFYGEKKILWNRDEPQETEGSKWTVNGYSLVKNLAQSDSGRYTVKDGNHRTLQTENIKVVADLRNFDLGIGQSFEFETNLEPQSCNIYFIPTEHNEQILIVHEGKTKYEFYNSLCQGLELLKPCGLANYNVHPPCQGHYTIRDEYGDSAMEVTVEVESPDELPVYFVILGFIIIVVIVCCCVVRCCFSRESRQKNTPQPAPAPEPEPAVNYPEFNRVPARVTRDQPNEPTSNQPVTHSSATSPLIHWPLPLDNPPSYSEVCPRFQEPQTPSSSFQSEPRYEVRGANFDLSTPLHADAPQSDVYNSDKLNFL